MSSYLDPTQAQVVYRQHALRAEAAERRLAAEARAGRQRRQMRVRWQWTQAGASLSWEGEPA